MMLEENLFGNVLKSLRVRRGKLWTQERTAELLEISRRTYAKWEDEDEGTIPSPEYLKRIVALFDLSQEERDTLYLAAAQTPPKIHNLPFPQNPFFTGRETYLEQLSQFLQENGNVEFTQPVSISGLGGIGKTQMALEYAHHCYPQVYRAVFWVNAADMETLQASYDSLAQLLELPERKEQELYRRIQAVKRWLEEHTNWLLIMDNADDLQLARSFFPGAHHGRILLTTRSQIVGNIATKIDIDKMEPGEALLFLLRRSGVLKGKTKIDTVDTDVRETAFQVVELLGGLPLALDQAGAYIEDTGESFAEYINLYHEACHLVLNRRGSLDGENEGKYSEHPETVAATFELCFRMSRERHPMATDILYFCAFLQPDAIPKELFQHDDSFRHDERAFREGILALRRYSLLKRTMQNQLISIQDQTFSLHRLVQVVLIDTMSPDLQKHWRERVVQAMNAAFPELVYKESSRCKRLLSHALLCATWTEDELTSSIGVASLFHKAGIYIYQLGHPSVAEALLERGLSIYEQHFGVEDIGTVRMLHNLAVIQCGLGKYEQAESLLLQALSIQEKLLGVGHPDTASSLHNLTILYLKQRKYEQRETWIDTLHWFTILTHEQVRHEQAEVLFQRDLSIQRQRLGETHPLTQSTRKNYTKFLREVGRDAEAAVLEVNDESSE